MSDCCNADALGKLHAEQRRVLILVFWINAIMFFVEFSAGWIANSTSLLADSLDMFGDAVVYGISLYALHKGAMWKARAAQVKGILLLLFAISVFVDVILKLLFDRQPDPYAMFSVMTVVLIANSYCLWKLTPFRESDINMRSVWLCSRNDVISNVAVLIAAVLTGLLASMWPDIVLGCFVALVFLWTCIKVLRESSDEIAKLKDAKASDGS